MNSRIQKYKSINHYLNENYLMNIKNWNKNWIYGYYIYIKDYPKNKYYTAKKKLEYFGFIVKIKYLNNNSVDIYAYFKFFSLTNKFFCRQYVKVRNTKISKMLIKDLKLTKKVPENVSIFLNNINDKDKWITNKNKNKLVYSETIEIKLNNKIDKYWFKQTNLYIPYLELKKIIPQITTKSNKLILSIIRYT